MNPPVEELFFTAASAFADDAERDAFLDFACEGQPDLRERLAALLNLEAKANLFFDFQPGAPAGDEKEPATGDPVIGMRFGRYRPIARIGSGGCGVVYHAEQEEPVKRKVALKVIKLGMDTEAVIARFDIERQALAKLNHPNIARVLDAGATGSGRPYFVMELVEGEKITDFCDTHHLNVRRRLELFVQVCGALQYAHQKGIIHRDIKPSNVIVDSQNGAPVPKVIDFGIAKATEANAAKEITSEQFDQFLGTPAYTSPEQVQCDTDIDTRSDIYSLGVLLYELLSGCLPFDPARLGDSSWEQIRRIITEEEAARPSASLQTTTPEQGVKIVENRDVDSVRRLASQLAGDLDWIVMKAIEKRRSHRYETANALAVDVIRYLNEEPVSARPPSRVYRFGKLVRRNKLIFVAAGIAFFGLSGGFAASTWLFFKEKAAREEQARLREKAELRELVARAAVQLKYGNLEKADSLLSHIPVEETPSSLEAVEVFDAVGSWHLEVGRLKEAGLRFASMARAIAEVDSSDAPSVSLHILPAAATLAYIGERGHYENLRTMAIERFGKTTNPVVAEEILKGCLLLPPDPRSVESLRPMAVLVRRAIENREGLTGTDPRHTAWACFSLSLMHYRAGEYAEAKQWADRCLAIPNKHEARTACMLIVRAMLEQKTGRSSNAQVTLEQVRPRVLAVLAAGDKFKSGGSATWVNWLCAAVLLSEADGMIGKG